MPSFISPQFTNETFGDNPTIDQKIDVFEDRVFGWQLNIAEAMDHIPHAGYGIIAALFSYFEMVAQYIAGQSSNGQSGQFFRQGFRDIYPHSPLTNAQIGTIYSRVRCGMYHSGYTKFGTLISGDYPNGVAIQDDTVLVNPHQLRNDLVTHFTSYLHTLRNSESHEARNHFETMFDAGVEP